MSTNRRDKPPAMNTGLLDLHTSMSLRSQDDSFRQVKVSHYASLNDTSKYEKDRRIRFSRYSTDFRGELKDHTVKVQLIPYKPYNNPFWDSLKIYLPITFWLPRYQWKLWFSSDLIAAITAIVMVIPQSMGYALIAGLNPIYGLYSALIGHCLYFPFATSGQLIVAPVAIVSLMVEETLGRTLDFNHSENEKLYAAYGSCLAFQVGIILLTLGIMRAGVLSNMLAEPVITGFTFAAAILIAISQLKFIFNMSDFEGEELIENVIHLFKHLDEIHAKSLYLSIACIVFLVFMRFLKKSQNPKLRFAKFIPDALIVVIIGTSVSYSIGVENTGWDIIGDSVQNGLPEFFNFFELIDMDTFWSLWTSSLLIAILAFIESIAVCQKFAEKHDYEVNASQEMIALGICNLFGCWFQTYPVAGVLSLAAVVEAAGAQTPLYTLMAGAGMIVVTSFFVTAFEYLPKPVLGSIVCVGVVNLIDMATIKEIWKMSPRRDFISMSITIIMTLVIGIDYGVAIGVLVSIAIFIQQAANPEYGVLGRDEQTENSKTIWKKCKYFDDVEQRSDMLVIQWDAVLFFGNIQAFKIKMKECIGQFLEEHDYPSQWCLVLSFECINSLDFTACQGLHHFIDEIKSKELGMTLVLSKLHFQVRNIMEKGHLIELVGSGNILDEVGQCEKWWDTNKNATDRDNSKSKTKRGNNYKLIKYDPKEPESPSVKTTAIVSSITYAKYNENKDKPTGS